MLLPRAYRGIARATLILTVCLITGTHAIVKSQSCTGTSTINDSTVSGFPQMGRLTLNGVASSCDGPKTFPGVADTNFRNVKVYNFVNNTNAVACITVTLDAGSCVGATGLFSAAYAGYNPADISANYLADIGASPNPSRSYSFNVPANSEFQVVVYQVNTNQTCPAFSLTVSGFGCPPVSNMLISEFRFGVDSTAPNANLDEYIELYNNTDAPLVVATTDGSAGWALVAADGLTRFVVPAGTIIPARGHYLGVNTLGYSLANYGGTGAAAGDVTYTTDIPLVSAGAGIALFNTSNPANFTLANRLDAVGFVNVPLLYRENGLTTFPVSSSGTNYFQVRSLVTGLPRDTGDNENDFVLVSANPDFGAVLGAPGPENLASPIQRNAQIKASFIDPASPASCTDATLACARVRDTTPNPGNLSTFGTLSIRRRFTNNTGQFVTRLRFRVVDITTLIGGTGVPPGIADIRVLSSSPISVILAGGGGLTLQGVTREEPPAQFNGGGLNTSLSAGTISLATPLAPGSSIDMHFLLGVQQTGVFRFFVNVEALNLPLATPQRSRRKPTILEAVNERGARHKVSERDGN
ncbi:MAG TPA: hypothetical protein VFH15_06975 [Pyrinomonadaceae bacterium]|nr:hypothetical protein [Pyrinomonadaceae bacterium]